MSEFTQHKTQRVEQLIVLFKGILMGEKLGQLVRDNQNVIDSCIPSDVISVVDQLVLLKIPMEDLKKGINKLLNLLHKTLSTHPYYPPSKESYLACLIENNRLLDEKLLSIKPLFRELNNDLNNHSIRKKLLEKFKEIEKFNSYYIIKENVLFPVIEKYIPEYRYRCLQVMW